MGWDYFGGGLDLEDAGKILYKEVNGTKIAFLGYNYYDSVLNNPGPLAGANKSGANPYSEEKLKRDIEEAKKNAPCIKIIDEIDAVARRRGTGLGGCHDEREQTHNK